MVDTRPETGWDDILQALDERRLARDREADESVQRHRAQGKLLVRERIERLLDPGSFEEIGSAAGTPVYEEGKLVAFRPSGYLMGLGRIDGRRVVVGGEDFTSRGTPGRGEGGGMSRSAFAERMAMDWRLPLVRLIDAFGANIRAVEGMGRTYVPRIPGIVMLKELMATVPVVGAVMGSIAGLPAAVAVASHWSIMIKGQSHIFPAGPPVVKRALGIDIHKEDLGGYQVHAMKSGVIDNLAENEDDCLQQIRRFLSYLPSSVWQAPPRLPTGDDPNRREEALSSIIPRNRSRVYDVRRMLRLVVDKDSLFELAPFYGRSLLTSFARLDGYPVGVLANDPRHIGGSLDAAASEKLTRFVDLCDLFHLPIVNFVDQPGFMVGRAAEEAGTIRKGTRALFAIQESRVPWLTIIVRKCYGVAGAGFTRYGGLEMLYAWPSAEWGSIPIEGGVDAAYRRDIASSPDPEARRRELEQRLVEMRSPIGAAEAFNVPEIIDPRDTRRRVCEFLEIAQELIRTQTGRKQGDGIRP
ncbi:MAG TPA: carboxyl transferase domain-containing protein [Dehalococcoidia bacterium]|nr:carboxyl transferase domain-containing protein [Dehalococcoidia bacterium]